MLFLYEVVNILVFLGNEIHATLQALPVQQMQLIDLIFECFFYPYIFSQFLVELFLRLLLDLVGVKKCPIHNRRVFFDSSAHTDAPLAIHVNKVQKLCGAM